MTAWSPKDDPLPEKGSGPQDAAESPRPSPRPAPVAACCASEPSDEALILRIAEARDRSAFAQLFHRYGARVKSYMIRAGAAPDQAEEAAQEAMLAVWRRAETFDPNRATAPAWIFAIARNKRIDLIRRAARFEPDDLEDPSLAPEPEKPADKLVAGAARDQAVRAALQQLGEEQRVVVVLAFYEGCAHSEIAERLDLPLGTVKSRLRLAFGKLRAVLGAHFHDELLDF